MKLQSNSKEGGTVRLSLCLSVLQINALHTKKKIWKDLTDYNPPF